MKDAIAPRSCRTGWPLLFFLPFLPLACEAGWAYCSVTVRAPDMPAAWSGAGGADAWELRWTWLGGAGGPVTLSPGQLAALALPRTGAAAIECRPAFGQRRGKPLGAMWPADRRADGSVEPDGPGGYAASLASALFRAGWDAARFDLGRFGREAALRMADPWDREPASFAAAVAEGRFRADRLNQPSRFSVTLGGIPCALASDSPWGGVLVPGQDGLAHIEMAAGLRRWFGSGYSLSVSVDASGSACWSLEPPGP